MALGGKTPFLYPDIAKILQHFQRAIKSSSWQGNAIFLLWWHWIDDSVDQKRKKGKW
jgi:hypothetical protein